MPGVYDTIDLGFNYRMSEIHAAIGSVQIKKLEKFLIKRKDNFLYLEKYLKNIPGIKILSQPSNEHFNSCYYCLGGLLDENIAPKRAKIITYLSKLGIGTSVYYPQPVPRMKYYRNKYSYDKNKYSVAAQISDSIIAFPVGPHLSKDEMEIIGFELKKYMQKNYYE